MTNGCPFTRGQYRDVPYSAKFEEVIILSGATTELSSLFAARLTNSWPG
jgi:hypothetical protein